MWQFYAEPLDLPFIQLSLLHVSETRDDNIVRPIWNRIFEEGMLRCIYLSTYVKRITDQPWKMQHLKLPPTA